MPRDLTDYADVQPRLKSGYLAILNRDNLIGRVGRGHGTHAAIVVVRDADQRSVAIAESREGYGGRVVNFSSQVRKFPGAWDVYAPNDDCPARLRERAATIAFNWAGHGYDYPGIFSKTLWHSPLVLAAASWFDLAPDMTSLELTPWDEPKVCSQLVAWAFRWAKCELYEDAHDCGSDHDAPDHDRPGLDHAGRRLRVWPTRVGWDPCPLLGDRWVEPADLARAAESGAFRLIARGLVIS